MCFPKIWLEQGKACCLSVIDRLPNLPKNKSYFGFWPLMTPGPTAHPADLHMTSMDMCRDHLSSVPETELLTLWPINSFVRFLPTFSAAVELWVPSQRSAGERSLSSASTLAAAQMPTDNHWHRWWAETQKDRQRKRTTHRSKKKRKTLHTLSRRGYCPTILSTHLF